MSDKFPQSDLPIRRTTDFLPVRFQTTANAKFFSGSIDALTQPGLLEKTVGYLGRRYGKTFNSKDLYLDDNGSLRSKYQLEPAVVLKNEDEISNFYDYLDFKNALKYFRNLNDRDDKITDQDHYTWNPPIDWDKFVNFREYFWVPAGPPPVKILGQNQEIISTYRVRLGTGSVWIFSPDGLTNNPTLTLYRGQTYKFDVNAPDNGFIIRTAYDTTSLSYNPDLPYSKGQVVLFDGKLWKAKVNISITDGSTINEESEDWEYIEPVSNSKALDYNKGITSNGLIQGTLEFNVPLDAPDILYYQSLTEPNRFGKFIIADVESNSKIDVLKEIVGKKDYKSSNGIQFSNGMLVYFEGQVIPESYKQGVWLVEGVGDRIILLDFQELVPSISSLNYPDVLFDNSGFDTDPFDDASLFPGTKDYIVINRASQDSNPWSRYNRWFHREILEFSHKFNGTDFDASDESRAKRPIIEFKRDLRLFNHGFKAKKSVDFIDKFTDDVFSKIEGSQGYIIDGEEIFQGARILFTADTDRLANNRIYQVNFINHSSSQVTKGDWSVFESYRLGETVRYNGQSFTSAIENPSIQLPILFSDDRTKTYRTTKNNQITEGMAISFTGTLFGGAEAGKLYYILEIDNSEDNLTEFSISASKNGARISLSFGAPGAEGMVGFASSHPTDNLAWDSRTSNRQVSLIKVEDTDPQLGDCVLIRRGKVDKGQMYHYDGNEWKISQQKTSFNQPPLFEVIDDNLISFADELTYPVSSFKGSKILSYRQNELGQDTELGFGLSYLNIDNIGDILFQFDWELDEFTFELENQSVTKRVDTGFYIYNDTENVENSWLSINRSFVQPIIYTKIVETTTDNIELNAIDWSTVENSSIYKIILTINGNLYNLSYERDGNTFYFDTILNEGDVVVIKVFADALPTEGYYEIPLGLTNNPLNENLTTFTLGQVTDHVFSGIELTDEFKGSFPGVSNLRDINGYQYNSRRFLKHSGVAALAMFLLSDRKTNLVKAINSSRKAYSDFKNKFVSLAAKLDVIENVADAVDDILRSISDSKKENIDPFNDSDMVGTGAFTSKKYIVDDTEIKTFALNEKFDLTTLSRTAVYIYQNGIQLLFGTQYVFNSNFGFVELKVDLIEGDEIEIREYVSTSSSFIPATPTKLGMYKKYNPEIYLDDTFINPTNVIQGHDGSITVAFNDYRDDLILELEKRIYNNIKISFSNEIFNQDEIIGGYYGNSVFKKIDVDNILAKNFRQWADLDIDFSNSFYRDENEFTWTYRPSFNRITEDDLPSFWRGMYFFYYDTDRPHLCPWEMLGFSEKPEWWESEYGSAPYTNGNLVLWEDLRDGIIRQGPRAGTYDRYKRPTLLQHIPVDGDGKLLSPNSSKLVGLLSNIALDEDFKFGDISPVESAWRRSSDYPYQIVSALCLLRPFEFILENFDKNLTKKNIIGQTVSKFTNKFLRLSDRIIPVSDGYQSSGLVNFLVDYYKQQRYPITDLQSIINSIDVNLSSRLSGFVDKDQQRFLIDSKNPSSETSSVFLPQENFEIFYNKSVVINKISYSGIIFEKLSDGYKISGYDKDDAFFSYYPIKQSPKDQLISVGGVTSTFLNWEINSNYTNGIIVFYQGLYYRSNRTHNSSTFFDPSLWTKLPKLPTIGAREAYVRKSFNKNVVANLEYGTVLRNEQDIVDFICGYQEYLQDQGFDFTEYDNELKLVRNWELSIREFLLWASQNWRPGIILSVSPASNNLFLKLDFGSIDDFTERFLDFQFVRSNGTIINVNQLDVWRDIGYTKVSIADPTDGIYFASFNVIVKEHIAVFSDRTVFNDILFDKITGYRQERIKFRGFRSVDWQGDLITPGFVLDNVVIDRWQPFRDYRLGDIVEYESTYYTSLENQAGAEEFNFTLWTKADSVYEKKLVPNFDFRINQFADFYNSDEGGLGNSQRDSARHLIAYQTRDYLEKLAEDDVTQFKLYQGFIREKGTINSVNKIFDKLSRAGSDSIDLFEEWAFKVGSYGGASQREYIEFELEKTQFNSNPQLLKILNGPISPIKVDQYYRINQNNFTIASIPYSKDIFSKSKFGDINRSAGYVAPYQVDVTIKSIEDLLTSNIYDYPENSHIWITFENNDWNVYRFSHTNALAIRALEKIGDVVILTFNRKHDFEVEELFGIKGITNLDGFYQVVSITSFTVEITVEEGAADPEFDESSLSFSVYRLRNARFSKFLDIDDRQAALLKSGSKLWIDSDTNDYWQVIEKTSQYTQYDTARIPLLDLEKIGSSVVYAESLKQSIVGSPIPGYVLILSESRNDLTTKQWLSPVVSEIEDFTPYMKNSYGATISLSSDEKLLAVGAPLGSGFLNNYKGEFDSNISYSTGSIVASRGKLWKASSNYSAGSSSFLDPDSEIWDVCQLVEATGFGASLPPNLVTGPFEQGAIFLYTLASGFWKYDSVILSPRMETGERFGSSISISVSGNKYYMAVSAPGAVNGMGRVYLFVRENNEWKTIEDNNYRGIFDFDGVDVPATLLIEGRQYKIKTQGTTDFTAIGAASNTPGEDFVATGLNNNISANALVPGRRYRITVRGTTNFTTVGSPSNVVGTEFTATGAAGGTGVVRLVLGTGVAKYAYYPEGAIVWWNNRLWKATQDFYGDGSSFPSVDGNWEPIDNVSTLSSLPTIPSYVDDGSTTTGGLLQDSTYTLDSLKAVELIKEGDRFGSSIAMNRDGSVLVIGAPFADGIYFFRFKGVWSPFQEYLPGDVIRYFDPISKTTSYRTLLGPSEIDGVDSSINDDPAGAPWAQVLDSSKVPSGKVFIYKRNTEGSYDLFQTITAENIEDINETDTTENIASGDNFGHAVDIDSSGISLIVSSPNADLDFQSQGSVFYFRNIGEGYKLKQRLQSYEEYPNENFGSSISISNRGEVISVGAINARTRYAAVYDGNQTIFDGGVTTFFSSAGSAGQVYVYENKDNKFFIVEKLDFDVDDGESFGASIDCKKDIVLVGSPTFTQNNIEIGRVRLFKRDAAVESWKIIGQETDLVDLNKIKNIRLLDSENDRFITDLDIVDHFKLKILGKAEQSINYKTMYDPAYYTINQEDPTNDIDLAWFDKFVGQVWWDLSTVKFIYAEQDTEDFRLSYFNKQVVGSSIDVYEWVESQYLPSQWAELADTPEGIVEGISGSPRSPDDTMYSEKNVFSPFTGEIISTKYYFWVKNSTVLPKNTNRTIPSASIASLIANPEASSIPFITFIDSDKIILWNVEDAMTSGRSLLNIEYNLVDIEKLNPIHNEYQLLTEGVADSLPTSLLEQKWLDSLIGYDETGNKVPDVTLTEKQKYGLLFRPRQTMFVDREDALKTTLKYVNTVLKSRPLTDNVSFINLNAFDPLPAEILNEYDFVVDKAIDLQNIGTSLVRRAILTVNIIDGSVDSINIIDPGVGYRNVPSIEIEGDGTGALAQVTLDNEGSVSSASVIFKGKNYTSAVVKIRNFSVLVNFDETFNNFWAIYAWDDQRKTYSKSKIQAFDVRNYWNFIDYYQEGYNANTRIIKELDNIYQEITTPTKIGDVIKVKEYGSGGWALFLRTGEDTADLSKKFTLIGRQNGTIEISIDRLLPPIGIGIDTISTYDGLVYDAQPSQELRYIFKSLKEDIFTDDLSVEWNKLFFSSVRTALIQSKNVDWAFKTSFVQAIHNVGKLEQKLTYKNDSLSSYQDYLNEIKPFKTVIREYVSKYDNIETSQTVFTDFDSPASYVTSIGKVLPGTASSELSSIYPWKWHTDYNSFSVISIEVSYPGEDYIQPPTILIEGDGTGAEAQAYVSNGTIAAIRVINSGQGYTYAPKISIVGGNGSSDKIAKAVAIIGLNPVRTFDLAVKFDRISKEGRLFQFEDSERFVAQGSNSVFELKYAPGRNRDEISIRLNSQIIFKDQYDISYYIDDASGLSLLRARLIFETPPNQGDIIDIIYERNDEYLDAVNRIQKYYFPSSGMTGKELPQLMTGIDYGGIEISGTTFEVTGGWDALPWFTDSWDSVETLSDFYYVADGSTAQVELPEAPPAGQMISIYIQRFSIEKPANVDKLGDDNSPSYIFNKAIIENKPIRIDDPNYGTSQSTNPTAVMPTFIGNGINKIVDFYNDATGGPYIDVNPGDTLIFRPFESDGAAIINDPNIIDTEISGGALNSNSQGIYKAPNTVDGAYSTAAGITAEEIVIEGGKFISPDTVPAPEENVPGQVLDSVSIKIYHTRPQGAAPLQNKVYIADGVERFFDIGLSIFESKSLLVYVDKVKIDEGFTIDFVNNRIEFATAPLTSKVVEIISLGIGGVSLLDYQEFVADGETNLFLTSALFSQTRSVVVTVDGIEIISEPLNSSDFTDIQGRVIIQLGITPLFRQVIKIVCLGEGFDADATLVPLIRVNDQQWTVKKYINIDLHRQTADSTLLDGNILGNIDLLELDGNYKILTINDGGENYISIPDTSYFPDGVITNFNYGRTVASETSLAVYLNNELQIYNDDYILNLETDEIVFSSPPPIGSSIKINELLVIYGEDVDSSSDIMVEVLSVNTNISRNNFIESLELKNQEFGTLVSDKLVNLQRANLISAIILDLDNNQLKGPDTVRLEYDGSNNIIDIGIDPEVTSGTITFNDISVYINNVLQPAITVYTFASAAKRITVNPSFLNVGDEIKIITTVSSEFTVIENNKLLLSNDIINQLDENTNLYLKSFSEYPSFDLISDQYSGGQLLYKLKRQPINSSYVWVYVNGLRLTKDIDYLVDVEKSQVSLRVDTVLSDDVKIIEFGNELWTFPNGFEIFKDMLNVNHYKRFSDNTVYLTQDLNYYDQEIFVNDTSSLTTPIPSRNLPGVIIVNKERIEYFQKTNNSLKQLRRGSLGTGIATVHKRNSKISDASNSESLPYKDSQERYDFVSDGSSILIGPFDFVPALADETNSLRFNWRNSWYRGVDPITGQDLIPMEYGPCDEIEVFVGGKRLRKDPITIYNESLGYIDSMTETVVEAEFSVDGDFPYIRLTTPAQAGTRITVIRRTGRIWYDKGSNTASAGKTLHKNNNSVLNFILSKSTSIPE